MSHSLHQLPVHSQLMCPPCRGLPPSQFACVNGVDNNFVCDLHYYCRMVSPRTNIPAYICHFKMILS